MPGTGKPTFGTFLIAVLLGITGLLSFLPVWHVLSLSLSKASAAAAGQVSFWPVGFNLDAYGLIVQDPRFLRAFLVSVERVILGGIVNVGLVILMAFPLSRSVREFAARNVYMWTLVVFMLIPGGLIPLWLVVRNLHLLDNIWSLILPTAVPIFNVILLMNFFRAIPQELDEAATLDGASPLVILWRIYLPLSLPALATITLFTVVGHWNAFFDALIYMNRPENYPLQTYIQQLIVNPDPSSNMLALQQQTLNTSLNQQTLNAAKLIVTMIPILLIYPFLQRYFIHGIILGSVKE